MARWKNDLTWAVAESTLTVNPCLAKSKATCIWWATLRNLLTKQEKSLNLFVKAHMYKTMKAFQKWFQRSDKFQMLTHPLSKVSIRERKDNFQSLWKLSRQNLWQLKKLLMHRISQGRSNRSIKNPETSIWLQIVFQKCLADSWMKKKIRQETRMLIMNSYKIIGHKMHC